MSSIAHLAQSLAVTVSILFLGLAGHALVFVPLERLFPSLREQSVWHRGSATDAIYWLLLPVINGMSGLLTPVVCSTLFPRACLDVYKHRILESLPVWLQVLVYAFLLDLTQYWLHRALHKQPLWRVHAVHHSLIEMDWMSTFRRHPLEMVLGNGIYIWLWTLTLSREALVAFALISIFTNFLPHANLNWTYGRLRYVFVSPIFHRWHHTFVDQGGLKNYANVFSCIDLMFGTYYMPVGATPREFGCPEEGLAEDVLRQMIFPFASRSAEEA
jgi:sterol desaturase/sphingolipid hydroxylase (fatty acid hydroxylase superfamily)